MTVLDLYGYLGDDLDKAKDDAEGLLQIEMEARESFFMGGDYFLYESGKARDEYITIRPNVDLIDGGPDEIDFPDYKFLLRAGLLRDLARAVEIQKKITPPSGNFVLLQREEIPDRQP